MMNFEERQKFYQETQLILKDKPQWRLFKMQLEDGKWESIRNQIRNPEQLKKILIKKAPINVFSTCSMWLNPLSIERPSWVYADRLFLGNDVFVDIDTHDIGAYNKTIEWFSKHPRYIFKRSVDSKYGFHIYYTDTKKIEEPNPLKRYELIKQEREQLAEELRMACQEVDINITDDLERVSREIGTLNDGDPVCSIIYDPQLGICSERLIADESEHHIPKYLDEYARTEHSAIHRYFWNFIDSFVEGTQLYDAKGRPGRYCVFIRKDKSFTIERFTKKLKQIQQIYNLSDFYVFETYNTFEAICPEALPYRRVLKILKKINSKNYAAFEKYHHQWIRTSHILDITTKQNVDEQPRALFKLENECTGKKIFSMPHYDYLGNYFNLKPKTLLIGNAKNKIRLASIRVEKNDD